MSFNLRQTPVRRHACLRFWLNQASILGMGIVTKTGDLGQTGLMYNRRVSKCHPQVGACGDVDELNAALGVARAAAIDSHIQDTLKHVQKELVPLMGEIATAPEDYERYLREKRSRLTDESIQQLEAMIGDVQSRGASYAHWATPGDNPQAAALDMARAVCRRAERAVCNLSEQGLLHLPRCIVYLNRLSDLLWLMARWSEKRPSSDEPTLMV